MNSEYYEVNQVRAPDMSYSDRLISGKLVEDEIRYEVTSQVSKDIEKYIPNDKDSLDELVMKKIQLVEEIYPKIENFSVDPTRYNLVLGEIDNLINIFTKCIEDVNEISIREKRMEFYKR
jgi:hypothetical protein